MIRYNVFYDIAFHAIRLVPTSSATIIENNTIDLVHEVSGISCDGSSPTIRYNIITRAMQGIRCLLAADPIFECNNIFDVKVGRYVGTCSDQTGMNGNISVDPEYCGIDDSGNYLLQSDSPCAPGNHPEGYSCGQIGAKGVGCEEVPVTQSTWGAIKSRFRKEDPK